MSDLIKTGGEMRKNRVFRIYELFVIFCALIYLHGKPLASEVKPIDFRPIYRDAIKAVDPLEILKSNSDTHKDYATF